MDVSTDARMRTSDEPIRTEDGVTLPATLLWGNGEGPAVLLSPAAAVERRFYRAFAAALVEAGARAVLTYDFRGVGASASHPSAQGFRMKHWGTRDFPAALARLIERSGPGPIVGIGHSFGGLAIGLSGVSERFERHAMVASLNGWYGRTRRPLAVFARMNLAGVPLSRALGRLPASLGLGTALAGPIFRDWARWCRHPDFLFADPDVSESRRFADVRLPLLSVGIDDDPWGTPEAVATLLDKFPNAEVSELWLGGENGRSVGHNGFFRRENADLWPPVVEFLLEGNRPEADAAGAWP